MPKNEDGEFELILGNRQLLSVFFIVVVLLGVFFTMGYIVGRNSGPMQPAEVASTHKETKPMVIDSAETKAQPKREEVPVEEKAAVVETKPQREEAKAPEPKKPEPVKQAVAPVPSDPPGGGTYLQLTATSQHEAEVYVDVLKKKGFKAITSPVPDKPGLVRVMVGPMTESAVPKMRADLVAAGFPGDKAFKR